MRERGTQVWLLVRCEQPWGVAVVENSAPPGTFSPSPTANSVGWSRSVCSTAVEVLSSAHPASLIAEVTDGLRPQCEVRESCCLPCSFAVAAVRLLLK